MSTSAQIAVPDGVQSLVAANLEQLRARIAQACQRAGRSTEAVTLVAVTKTRTAEEIVAAYRCGARDFGENRVEEAEVKVPELVGTFASDPASWHMIGHVQSRKARRAVEIADIIHSVDSLRLAQRLDRLSGEMGKRMPVLLEVNVSGEASKSGFGASDDPSREAFVAQVPQLGDLRNLDVRGLMTMAPIVPDPEDARPVFRRLRELRDALRDRMPFSRWDALSMGMTDDFEVAIEEGATILRVGRAIFGPREYG